MSKTTRAYVDPKTIEDRNPVPVYEDYAGGAGATFQSFPVADPFDRPTHRGPVELVATSPVSVVSMVVFKDRLFVATSESVFERGDDGVFRKCRLVSSAPPQP